VSAIALASMIFAEPFWNVINSDKHYLDLFEDLFLSDKYASHCCLAPFFSSPHGPNTSEEVLIKRMADGSELCLLNCSFRFS
jgi:hypothetical protein